MNTPLTIKITALVLAFVMNTVLMGSVAAVFADAGTHAAAVAQTEILVTARAA
jgi:hypothetical protein